VPSITSAYKRAWLKRYRARPEIRERENARNRKASRKRNAAIQAAQLVVEATENPNVSPEAKAELVRLWKEANEAPPSDE
jgi:hypothetical protein